MPSSAPALDLAPVSAMTPFAPRHSRRHRARDRLGRQTSPPRRSPPHQRRRPVGERRVPAGGAALAARQEREAAEKAAADAIEAARRAGQRPPPGYQPPAARIFREESPSASARRWRPSSASPTPRLVLVQPFLRRRRQGRAAAPHRRRLRARGHPPACPWLLPAHAEGGGTAPRDAALSRQPPVGRAFVARRPAPRPRPQREPRPRAPGAAHPRRRRRLQPGRRDEPRPRHHRLDRARPLRRGRRDGAFFFNANRHEPGAKTVLGRTYPDAGLAQGEAILDDLARRHPATPAHIATKLARHFIADDPPADLVARLAKVFRDTDGNLPALYRVLVAASPPFRSRASCARRSTSPLRRCA